MLSYSNSMSWEKEMWLMWHTLSKRNPRAHLVLVLGCSKARATMLCNASSVGCQRQAAAAEATDRQHGGKSRPRSVVRS